MPKDCLTEKESERIQPWSQGSRGPPAPARAPDAREEAAAQVTRSLEAGSLGLAGTREVLLVGAGQAVRQK